MPIDNREIRKFYKEKYMEDVPTWQGLKVRGFYWNKN